MHIPQFKVGDRVRCRPDNMAHRLKHGGLINGTVTSVELLGPGHQYVTFKCGDQYGGASAYQLELNTNVPRWRRQPQGA